MNNAFLARAGAAAREARASIKAAGMQTRFWAIQPMTLAVFIVIGLGVAACALAARFGLSATAFWRLASRLTPAQAFSLKVQCGAISLLTLGFLATFVRDLRRANKRTKRTEKWQAMRARVEATKGEAAARREEIALRECVDHARDKLAKNQKSAEIGAGRPIGRGDLQIETNSGSLTAKRKPRRL